MLERFLASCIITLCFIAFLLEVFATQAKFFGTFLSLIINIAARQLRNLGIFLAQLLPENWPIEIFVLRNNRISLEVILPQPVPPTHEIIEQEPLLTPPLEERSPSPQSPPERVVVENPIVW
jgi:hypothetical protein